MKLTDQPKNLIEAVQKIIESSGVLPGGREVGNMIYYDRDPKTGGKGKFIAVPPEKEGTISPSEVETGLRIHLGASEKNARSLAQDMYGAKYGVYPKTFPRAAKPEVGQTTIKPIKKEPTARKSFKDFISTPSTEMDSGSK